MALVNVSPPGAKNQKGGALDNAADVMKIVGSLGGLYDTFSKPVKGADSLINDYAKRRISELENQAKVMATYNELLANQGGPAMKYHLIDVSKKVK